MTTSLKRKAKAEQLTRLEKLRVIAVTAKAEQKAAKRKNPFQCYCSLVEREMISECQIHWFAYRTSEARH